MFDGQATPGAPCPFGSDLSYHWEMRASLFSRVEQGVRFDEVGLIGVKLEEAALRCARKLAGRTALDAFAGIGGSAIALARSGKRVVSFDLDLSRLDMARHNASLYGVGDRILFVRGDVRDQLGAARLDCIYLDPPWGGVEAAERARFHLRDFQPSGEELVAAALEMATSVALCVPPNFDFADLDRWRPDEIDPVRWKGEILYYDVFFLAR